MRSRDRAAYCCSCRPFHRTVASLRVECRRFGWRSFGVRPASTRHDGGTAVGKGIRWTATTASAPTAPAPSAPVGTATGWHRERRVGTRSFPRDGHRGNHPRGHGARRTWRLVTHDDDNDDTAQQLHRPGGAAAALLILRHNHRHRVRAWLSGLRVACERRSVRLESRHRFRRRRRGYRPGHCCVTCVPVLVWLRLRRVR